MYYPLIMRKLVVFTCLISIAAIGCNQNQSAKNTKVSDTTASECYSSIVAKDSATLKLYTVNKKIAGKLHLMFAKKQHMNGEISGVFKGDTLYGDYIYTLGKGKETFKNPVAFLKKDGKLYQGYGELLTQYGRTFFDNKVPIDFDKGFVFEPINCN